jgi:uncharacterized protein YgbK (DUF1537 family)
MSEDLGRNSAEPTEPVPILEAEKLQALPREWPETDLRAKIRSALLGSERKVVVLDDDPTGTQTVHSLPVLTRWTAKALAEAWDEAETTFYVLTNSRRYPSDEAAAMNREIACNLAVVARARGAEPVVVSRSDSTLRGHFPAEVDALRETLEMELGLFYDGVIIIPFFLEGGRLTVDDVHWVREGNWLTPAAQTEFARDPTFGYSQSNLCRWVAEKTGGLVRSEDVVSIGLDVIRHDGPAGVAELLSQVHERQVVIINAVSYRDLEVFVWGLVQAERNGKRYIFRSAASFVQVRGGVTERGLLSRAELFYGEQPARAGGLTLVGSYVQRTTQQLRQALKLRGTLGIELRVSAVLGEDTLSAETHRVLRETMQGLQQGQDVIVFTSRDLEVPPGMSQLQAGQRVSAALVDVLRRLSVRPSYLVAKGGITSSDLATDALGVRRARVLGQIVPGVPVWRLGGESKYPSLPYVVFPGNVGEDDALARTIELLSG